MEHVDAAACDLSTVSQIAEGFVATVECGFKVVPATPFPTLELRPAVAEKVQTALPRLSTILRRSSPTPPLPGATPICFISLQSLLCVRYRWKSGVEDVFSQIWKAGFSFPQVESLTQHKTNT